MICLGETVISSWIVGTSSMMSSPAGLRLSITLLATVVSTVLEWISSRGESLAGKRGEARAIELSGSDAAGGEYK